MVTGSTVTVTIQPNLTSYTLCYCIVSVALPDVRGHTRALVHCSTTLKTSPKLIFCIFLFIPGVNKLLFKLSACNQVRAKELCFCYLAIANTGVRVPSFRHYKLAGFIFTFVLHDYCDSLVYGCILCISGYDTCVHVHFHCISCIILVTAPHIITVIITAFLGDFPTATLPLL